MPGIYKTPGVHIESAGDRHIPLEAVETGVTAFLGISDTGPRNKPVLVTTSEQYEKLFGQSDTFLSHAVHGFFDNGGVKAYVLNCKRGALVAPDDFIGTQGTDKRGLRLLEDLDDVDLIVAPSLMEHYRNSPMLAAPEDLAAVQLAMVAHCERLHSRFAILDCPPEMSRAEIQEYRQQFDSSFAAMYYPWIRVRVGDEPSPPIVPGGHVAGMFAKADRTVGVHRTAANMPIEGLVDVERLIHKKERDLLFEHEVNGIYPFPGRGIRIWGSRTLSSDPSWTQINVRRLMILIRKSIERYAQWVVFEPNEPALWKKLTRTIDSFLFDLFKEGALVGGTKEEAFYVKCDEETNPPESRDVGQLICEIGIAPVRPAEFIVVRIHQWTREASGQKVEPDEDVGTPP